MQKLPVLVWQYQKEFNKLLWLLELYKSTVDLHLTVTVYLFVDNYNMKTRSDANLELENFRFIKI